MVLHAVSERAGPAAIGSSARLPAWRGCCACVCAHSRCRSAYTSPCLVAGQARSPPYLSLPFRLLDPRPGASSAFPHYHAGFPTASHIQCGSKCINPKTTCCLANTSVGLKCTAPSICSGDGGTCITQPSKNIVHAGAMHLSAHLGVRLNGHCPFLLATWLPGFSLTHGSRPWAGPTSAAGAEGPGGMILLLWFRFSVVCVTYFTCLMPCLPLPVCSLPRREDQVWISLH